MNEDDVFVRALLKLPRPDLLQRLVAQRSLLPPPREDIHTAPFLSAVRPLAFLCVMAQRLCVSAVTCLRRPAPNACRSVATACAAAADDVHTAPLLRAVHPRASL